MTLSLQFEVEFKKIAKTTNDGSQVGQTFPETFIRIYSWKIKPLKQEVRDKNGKKKSNSRTSQQLRCIVSISMQAVVRMEKKHSSPLDYFKMSCCCHSLQVSWKICALGQEASRISTQRTFAG